MLSSHQYGFRMGISTTLAVYDMQDNILENLEKGFITCTIFRDLFKHLTLSIMMCYCGN